MKLTVLGNCSPYPTEFSGGSSYLLQDGENNILLDVGPDTLHNLQKVIPYQQLDAVIISHLHLDHFLDLLPLHYAIMLAIKKGQREEALSVYLPFDDSTELDFIRAKVGEEFHLQELTAERKLEFGDLEFSFYPTIHPQECFAVKATKSNLSLGYTADTGFDQQLINFFAESDLLLAEASLLEQDKERRALGHMTVKEAVEFGAQANVTRLILTHLAATYNLAAIKAEIPEVDFAVEVSKILESYFIS